MKLRNKKTGEIGNLVSTNWDEVVLKVLDDNGVQLGKYTSLAGLYEDWKDYEEPKPNYHWFISGRGTIEYEENADDYFNRGHKAIGNYFETREEVEKAVEKLKAFANLRKRGLKFNGWDDADRGMVGEFDIYCDALELDGIERELEIVFGREEL